MTEYQYYKEYRNRGRSIPYGTVIAVSNPYVHVPNEPWPETIYAVCSGTYPEPWIRMISIVNTYLFYYCIPISKEKAREIQPALVEFVDNLDEEEICSPTVS